MGSWQNNYYPNVAIGQTNVSWWQPFFSKVKMKNCEHSVHGSIFPAHR